MEHNEELKDLNSKIEIDSKSPYKINNLLIKPALAIVLFSFYQNSNFVAINQLSDLGYGFGMLEMDGGFYQFYVFVFKFLVIGIL